MTFNSNSSPRCPRKNQATSSTGPGYSRFAFIDPEPEPQGSVKPCYTSPYLGAAHKTTICGAIIANQSAVVVLDSFSRDIQFRRFVTGTGLKEPRKDRPPRGKIDSFSPRSQRRLIHRVKNENIRTESTFCLTYHNNFPSSGKVCKQHLDNFMRCLRRKLSDRFWGHLWVIEWQKRGAPHFHLYLTFPPDRQLGLWMATTWNRITSGGPGHLYWHSREDNFRAWDHGKGNFRYACKEYLAKADQKQIPADFHSVGRFWGNSRTIAPKAWRHDFKELQELFHAGWTEPMIRNWLLRTFRRFYDAKIRRQRAYFQAKGEKYKGGRFKQKGCWLGRGDWRTVTINGGTRLFHRLVTWAKANAPPTSDMIYGGNRSEVPF